MICIQYKNGNDCHNFKKEKKTEMGLNANVKIRATKWKFMLVGCLPLNFINFDSLWNTLW